MEGGLRVAETVEFAGLDAKPNERRANVLVDGVRQMLPGLTYDRVETWMGHRPSLPDSMPVIGRSPHVANAYFAFGHGHVGLTAAPSTGEIIAALVAGEAPYMDPRPFDAERFGGER